MRRSLENVRSNRSKSCRRLRAFARLARSRHPALGGFNQGVGLSKLHSPLPTDDTVVAVKSMSRYAITVLHTPQ